MLEQLQPQGLITTLVVFGLASGIAVIASILVSRTKKGANERLEELMREDKPNVPRLQHPRNFKSAALPKLATPLVPTNEADLSRLRAQLYKAGMYAPMAMQMFLGVKLILIIGPVIIAVALWLLNLAPFEKSVTWGCIAGIAGIFGPSLYLSSRTSERHKILRRGIPDALDLLVVCLEAGLTLEAAFRRVTSNFRTAHPELTVELTLVQHDTEIGRSSGQALQNFAARSQLAEVKMLANVVTQAERFGASIVNSLRVHAKDLREKRRQHAEQKAQRAGTWILIPTVLFIFPGIFIVILGPAAVSVWKTFNQLD